MIGEGRSGLVEGAPEMSVALNVKVGRAETDLRWALWFWGGGLRFICIETGRLCVGDDELLLLGFGRAGKTKSGLGTS